MSYGKIQSKSRIWQTFPRKDQRINILSFVSEVVCWNCSTELLQRESSVGNMWMNECGHIPIALYLQNQAVSGIWPMDHVYWSWPQNKYCKFNYLPWSRSSGVCDKSGSMHAISELTPPPADSGQAEWAPREARSWDLPKTAVYLDFYGIVSNFYFFIF